MNQDRRHHIPKQRHRVTNWAAYDIAFRQRGRAPSTCQVGLAGCRRWQCALGIYDQPMLQISAQTWNVWVLEALCSAAVT